MRRVAVRGERPVCPSLCGMSFDAHVLKVLIASPGDTVEERNAVERALHEWNGDRAEREQVILLPRRWELHAVPRLGGSGQSIINEQLVDKADIVLALFDARLGMSTDDAVSGTASEIQRSHDAGKPVHVWFSDEPIPRDADLEQVRALRESKEKLTPLGLLGTYSSPGDLAYKVRQAVEDDLNQLNLGAVQKRTPAEDHAVLRARYDSKREQYSDNKGRIKYRTRGERVVVRNSGSLPARSVRIHLRALTETGNAPQVLANTTPDLLPGGEFAWPIAAAGFTGASGFEVVMTWKEGEDERTEYQHVSA